MYWSPSSRTALAEAELEYDENHKSTAAFVRFPVVGMPPELANDPSVGSDQLGALIWTTTPWTLPANEAIAVNPGLSYAVLKTPSWGQLLVAESRIAYLSDACLEGSSYVVKGSIPGSVLAGRTRYIHPLRGRDSRPQPVINANFVSEDSGTGLVHCAPGHGMEDYEVCKSHGIAVTAPVDDEGRFTKEASRLAGKEVLSSGSSEVLTWLRELDALVKSYTYRHKYPYDWRTKLPVIVRATRQWFANVDRIKESAKKLVAAAEFLPISGRARLESFLGGRSEWCISRQRAWGVPIPALYHKVTGDALLTPDSVGHMISVIERRGIDAWWTDADDDPAWIPPDFLARDPPAAYRRGQDTMDVWFDSGTSWTQIDRNSAMGKDALADVYLEGTDQHRGWFQSSLLTYCAHRSASSAGLDSPRRLPLFKKLITHGFTLDSDGRKMSKSVGNVISPEQIMNGSLDTFKAGQKSEAKTTRTTQRGADWIDLTTLRLWVASSDYTKDVTISQQTLTAVRASAQKFGLTLKWILGNLNDFDPSSTVPYDLLSKIDQIALLQLSRVNGKLLELYKQYEYSNGKYSSTLRA